MKKLFLFTLIAALTACQAEPESAQRSELVWLESWDKAVELSAKSDKPLLLEASTEWCHYCNHYKEKIFPQQQVIEKMREFVLLHLDGDKGEVQPLLDKFNITGYPTMIIFDSKQKELVRFNSVNSAETFLSRLLAAQQVDPLYLQYKQAEKLELAGKNAEALVLYRELNEKLQSTSSKLRENVLHRLFWLSESAEQVGHAKTLLKLFPASPYVPSYYKVLADFHSSSVVLNKKYLELGASVIEEWLNRLEEQSSLVVRETLDMHIDLLADYYRDMGRYSEISTLYFQAASACEQKIIAEGGIKNNTYLIGHVAHYYNQANEPKRAVAFLDRAAKQLPNFWPIYSYYAQAYLNLAQYEKAEAEAKKGYELADEVAKSRIALRWADSLIGQKKTAAALAVLANAKAYLQEFSSADSGSAKRMIAKLDKRAAEYRLHQD